jgi:hypothetical protein
VRLKASKPQRILMLGFMFGVCTWAAWPDWKLIILSGLAVVAAALWLLSPAR